MKPTGTVRLVDKKTRVVELVGPEPPGARRPTDRELLFDVYGPFPARPVGVCFQAKGRSARFLVDEGPLGDRLLEMLAKKPTPASPYGMKAWRVRE